MPSAERLASGRYRAVYETPRAPGEKRRKLRVKGTFATKREAMDAAIEAQGKAKRRAAPARGPVSARTPWGEWWPIAHQYRHDSNTGPTEARLAKRHLMPRWGSVALNEITRRACKEWVGDLVAAGYDPRYVGLIVGLFSRSLNRAVDEEVLDANPCARIKRPRPRGKPKRYMNHEDEERVLPAVREDVRDAVEFAYETALRPGELAGLHLNRVDLEGKALWVREVYVEYRKVIRPWPKDGDARQVPLTDKAVEIVKRAIEGRDMATGCGVPHSDGGGCRSELVFRTRARGAVMNPRLVGDHLREAARSVGAADLSGYPVRRGMLTKARDGGADELTLQKVAGHSTLGQTEGYVQFTQAAAQELRAALGDPVRLEAVRRGTRGGPRGTDQCPGVSPPVPEDVEEDTA